MTAELDSEQSADTGWRPSSWMWRLHIVLAVGLFLLIQLEMWVISLDALPPQRRPVALLISLFAAAPLAVMSRPSLWPFAVNALATMGFVSLGYQSEVYQWGNLILLGMVGMLLPGWRSWVGLAGGLAGVSYYFLTFEDESRGTWLMVAAIWIMAWLIGRVYGSQQAQARLRAERDLADEIAATRQERLELESQRSRMARELHDLIGHTVNVMVVHAGGGRRAVRTDPDGAEAAFATIESTGRAALDELDRVLGILRDKDSDAPVAPLPGLESIAGLVQEFEQAGLPTTLALNGPVDAVPGGVGLTIYRVVQEALTNTLKHAEADRAVVDVQVDERGVEVSISDDGHGPDRSAEVGHGGRGLSGIRERVGLHGGSVTHGAGADGRGFVVVCTLPLTASEVQS